MSVTPIKTRGGSEPRIFPNCEGVQSRELLTLNPGLTYRQLDFWTRSGRLKAHYHLGGKITLESGSGRTACWLPDQVKIIGRVAALLRRGFQLDHAFALAIDREQVKKALCELTYIDADLDEEAEREKVTA